MAFEVLNQQMRALNTIAGSLTGQVTSFHMGLLQSQLGSPLLSGQLVLVDALKLMAIIELLPDMQGYDFDIYIGSMERLDFRETERILTQLDKTAQELIQIEEVIRNLEQIISQMNMLLGQLAMAAEQLTQISQAFQQESSTVSNSLSQLQAGILPQLYDFRTTLTGLLERYRAEANIRAYFLYTNHRRFKPFLPLSYGTKLKRQKEEGEAGVLFGLARLQTEFGRWGRMHRLLLRYVERQGKRVEDYVRAMSVPINRGKFSFALKLLEEAIKEHPTEIAIPRQLADMFAKRGMTEQEDAVWEMWCEAHPKSAQARQEVEKLKATREQGEETA
ncbi:MAG: hypothetical protein CMH57_14425 [Myxococcales bacterium]|nr:hypothetical protein [Myxococcales bacterium]